MAGAQSQHDSMRGWRRHPPQPAPAKPGWCPMPALDDGSPLHAEEPQVLTAAALYAASWVPPYVFASPATARGHADCCLASYQGPSQSQQLDWIWSCPTLGWNPTVFQPLGMKSYLATCSRTCTPESLGDLWSWREWVGRLPTWCCLSNLFLAHHLLTFLVSDSRWLSPGEVSQPCPGQCCPLPSRGPGLSLHAHPGARWEGQGRKTSAEGAAGHEALAQTGQEWATKMTLERAGSQDKWAYLGPHIVGCR